MATMRTSTPARTAGASAPETKTRTITLKAPKLFCTMNEVRLNAIFVQAKIIARLYPERTIICVSPTPLIVHVSLLLKFHL